VGSSTLGILAPCAGRNTGCATCLHSETRLVGASGRADILIWDFPVLHVDDCLLRVGSANLINRSMGADTVCDLAFEAASQDHRQFIIRRRLIGHFCGVDEQEIAANKADLFGFLDRVSTGEAEKSLQPIDPPTALGGIASVVQPVADPEEPLVLQAPADGMRTMKTILVACGIAAVFAGIAFAWRHSALSGFADIAFVSSIIAQYAQSPFAPLLAIAAFVAGGLVVFPVVVLIAATAAALGPWMGFFCATIGTFLSGLLLFSIGRALGRERLQRLLGHRAKLIQDSIVGKGLIAVALIRMVPVAPFSIVNVVAGASKLRLRDFAIGTALGMAPGNLALAALGSQFVELARNASWSNLLLFGLVLVAWVAFCLVVQMLLTRSTREQT